MTMDAVPKHILRTERAIAAELCSAHFTDGFCHPKDRPDCKCNQLAKACVQAMAIVGVVPLWLFDKAIAGFPLPASTEQRAAAIEAALETIVAAVDAYRPDLSLEAMTAASREAKALIGGPEGPTQRPARHARAPP